MRTIAVLFAFALVTSTTYLSGQQPAAATSAQPAATTQDYSAESVVVEKLSTVYRFAAVGTGSREMTAVIRIQSDAAARQYGVLDFSFASNNERVEIDYVRVRKPDGSLVETPAADAQEMPLEVTRQAPFYSDLKQKQVPVRNLRMGDRLEYKVRVVDTTAEVPGQFWGQESFGRWAVILDQAVELHVPKPKYVKVWSPSAQPAKNETADEITYRWTGSQLTPVAPKDSPLKHLEFDPKGELATIAWTTFKSWDEVGTWYRSLEADRIVPDATVKARVAELTAGKTTEEEKAHVLYSYVATQIRYIGVAFGIGRYQPHPAAEVMRNQYGDCKDKHTLLAAMLTAAGLHPSASMIGAGIRLNEEVPSPAAFNHMITMVPMNGRQVWLDTTAEVAPWGMLVASTRDKETLVVPDSGTPKLEKTPQALPFIPLNRFVAKGTLSKEGTMHAQMEYTARGDDELMLRILLRQVPPGQWDELSQKLSQGIGFSGTTSHTVAGNPDKTDDPIRISYDYEREKTGDWDNHRIIPLFPVLFINPIDDKYPPKKQPIQLGEPHVETSLAIITLPSGWGAQLPEAVHQKTPYITLDKTYKMDGSTLTVERRMEVLQREIPASEWRTYKDWYDKSIGDGENYIQLTNFRDEPTSTAPTANANQDLLNEAHAAFLRNDLKTARQKLDLVRTNNSSEPRLWMLYSNIDGREGKDEAAIHDLEQELSNHPDEVQLYDPLLHMQLNLKHRDAAEETLKKQIAAQPFAMKPALMLGNMLSYDGKYPDAVKVLQAAYERSPNDDLRPTILLRLGIAQLKGENKEEGRDTLGGLLAVTSDPLILNDAAYELANASIEMEASEKSAEKAIQILTAQTADYKLDGNAKMQAQTTNLLVSAWDTLGWIYFRKGKLDLAEQYIMATWLYQRTSEAGLHLGEVKEARGDRRSALLLYNIALGRSDAKAFADDLKLRVKALQTEGISIPAKEISDSILALRQIRMPNPEQHVGIADYDVLLSGGNVVDVRPLPDAATHLSDGEAKVRSINFKQWMPPGSAAKIRIRVLMNCKPEKCELERLPI